jgi:enoyl-CoA hydratase/carnithine racemase
LIADNLGDYFSLNCQRRLYPGEYVGLTGARLDGAEMLACGLATHFVHLNVGLLMI